MLLSVDVPKQMRKTFEEAQSKVEEYFSKRKEDHSKGILKIAGNRHVLLRGDVLAFDFFQTIYDIYGENKHSIDVGMSLMFDVAHAAGSKDAAKFHQLMNLTDPIEKLSVGPVFFAYTGFSRVTIHENSNLVGNDDFVLRFGLKNSFESESWLSNKGKVERPNCIVSAAYASGWCSESFGIPLVAVEYRCISMGHETCEFVMAPPHCIDDHLSKIVTDFHDRLYVPRFFGRKQKEENLKRLAYQDILTGLTNRAMFRKLAQQTLKFAARQKKINIGFLFMDVDDFKDVNDNYSHQAGDFVLCEVANRLVRHMRKSDIICRYGGDEFVALIYEPRAEYDLRVVSEKIINTINEPIAYKGDLLQVGISIGALFWEGGHSFDLEELLELTDRAMYRAKEAGKNNVFIIKY